MQIQVHQCGFIGCRYNFISVKSLVFQKFLLFSVQCIIVRVSKKRLSRKEEIAAAVAGIYVPTDFDTKEKALSVANTAEKGLK